MQKYQQAGSGRHDDGHPAGLAVNVENSKGSPEKNKCAP
jgi:hypothetical protein